MCKIKQCEDPVFWHRWTSRILKNTTELVMIDLCCSCVSVLPITVIIIVYNSEISRTSTQSHTMVWLVGTSRSCTTVGYDIGFKLYYMKSYMKGWVQNSWNLIKNENVENQFEVYKNCFWIPGNKNKILSQFNSIQLILLV